MQSMIRCGINLFIVLVIKSFFLLSFYLMENVFNNLSVISQYVNQRRLENKCDFTSQLMCTLLNLYLQKLMSLILNCFLKGLCTKVLLTFSFLLSYFLLIMCKIL